MNRTPQDKPALTIKEISELTGWSPQTVTRLFEKERGVLIIHHPGKLNKRRYRSIRIPRHVYERVIRGISV